MSTRYANNLP